MKHVQRLISIIAIMLIFAGLTSAQEFQPESLGRGVVAVAVPDGGIYIGWRYLASDPDSVKFNVYRGTTRVNSEPLAAATNLVDPDGTVDGTYSVAPVIEGVEQEASREVTPWEQNYLTVPLQVPPEGTTPGFTCTDGTGTRDHPDGQDYSYSPNDASAADLDGDGEYEIVLKWDPSNAHDNAHCGYTGNSILDAYEMDGTLLWRIDLGVNVRAGAHYTPFMVYDLDGDGMAELVCRTASGSKDGTGAFISDGPAAGADHSADYRNSAGYVLTGPEYLTVFNGSDGSERATVDLEPARGNVGDWGDTYGNRVDRLMAAVVHLGGENPSVVWTRGIYTKVELAAWDLVEDELVLRWHFKSQEGYPDWSGMGSHNLSVADVDGDNKDEIIYGNCAIDDDGTGLWTLRDEISTPFAWTGDAMHVADIVPERPGLEKWGSGEGDYNPFSHLVDAATGEVIWVTVNGDGPRATTGDLVPDYDGMECWGSTDGLRSANNERVGPVPPSTNHVIWWDGDLGRELLDSNNIRKYGDSHPILLLADGCSSNNGSKANPCLQADLFGDWREEVIWRTSDNNNLRIYTTTDFTEYRITTLMHDPQYRLAIAWQNASYNQPPHTSFFLGYGMFTPDSLRPPHRPRNLRTFAWDDTVQVEWDANSNADLAGYSLYRGKSEDNLTVLADVGLATSYLDTNVTNDTTYYYAVTAYDTDGNESAYSEVVQAIPTIRPAAPSGISYRYDNDTIMLLWASQDFEHIANVNVYRSETADMASAVRFVRDKSSVTFIEGNLTAGKTYYYALSVTDTNQVESFRTEALGITPASSFTFQSEDATHLGTVFLDDNHLGFHGTGFVNFDGNNSGVEFTNMPGFGGGARTLVFRYALGNTDRTGALTVNGNTSDLTMVGTGDWTNYVEDTVAVNLNDGFDNTIRFEATGSDFGNLDEITIVAMTPTSVDPKDGESNIPSRFQLSQNYPNPFNPQTTISFGLPQAARVSINVYDIRGRLVRRLVNKDYQAGTYQVPFDGTNLASGVYFVRSRMTASGEEYVFTKKMMLLK